VSWAGGCIVVIVTRFGFDIDPNGEQRGLSSRPERVKRKAMDKL
jgi:hypothetical protein